MRIRTILAAAAAPAALAAVLLGTAGQASAAVKAPVTYSATAHEQGVDDTTVGGLTGTSTHDSGGGPVWAQDNIERKLTATQNVDNTWSVQISSQGSYAASANPLDGRPWNGNGSFTGYVNYTVPAGYAPDNSRLPSQLDNSLHSADIVALWFGMLNSNDVVGGSYSFDYNSIQVPDDIQGTNAAALTAGSVTWGQGPNHQHMVQVG